MRETSGDQKGRIIEDSTMNGAPLISVLRQKSIQRTAEIVKEVIAVPDKDKNEENERESLFELSEHNYEFNDPQGQETLRKEGDNNHMESYDELLIEEELQRNQ